MIDNIIRIDHETFDRLKLLTERPRYSEDTFNIAIRDKFPLHDIHYVFDNINKGEVYEVDTNIVVEEDNHTYKCVVYYKHRCIGISSITFLEYRPETSDWQMRYKVKPLVGGKQKEQWLKEVALMTATMTMLCSYAMLYTEKVFKESSGKHRLVVNSKSDCDEIIYSKLKALCPHIYENKSSKGTGKGVVPKHEFDVRGHDRHYKSGKVVHIKGYTKCKGRGTKIIHEYEMNDSENGVRGSISPTNRKDA